jgi:hypothetical protein
MVGGVDTERVESERLFLPERRSHRLLARLLDARIDQAPDVLWEFVIQENLDRPEPRLIHTQPRLQAMLNLLSQAVLRHACGGAEEQCPVPLRHEPKRLDVGAEKVRPELSEQFLADELVRSRRANPRRLAASEFFRFHRQAPCLETFSQPTPLTGTLSLFEPITAFGPVLGSAGSCH